MKWDFSTIDQYMHNKEYIDTAIIPFVRVQVGENIKQIVNEAAFVTNVSNQLEEHLTGRALLLPAYTFIQFENKDQIVENINMYSAHLKANGFEHVCITTVEDSLRQLNDEIDGTVLLVAESAEEIDNHSGAHLQKKAQQLVSSIIKMWQNN